MANGEEGETDSSEKVSFCSNAGEVVVDGGRGGVEIGSSVIGIGSSVISSDSSMVFSSEMSCIVIGCCFVSSVAVILLTELATSTFSVVVFCVGVSDVSSVAEQPELLESTSGWSAIITIY